MIDLLRRERADSVGLDAVAIDRWTRWGERGDAVMGECVRLMDDGLTFDARDDRRARYLTLAVPRRRRERRR